MKQATQIHSALTAVLVSAIGRLPLSENFSLFGELGGYIYHAESATETDNGLSPLAGVGLNYKMSNSFDLQARYRRTEQIGRDRNTGMNDNNYFGLELVYHIGRAAPVAVVAPIIEPTPDLEPELIVEVEPVYITKKIENRETVLFDFDSSSLDYQAKATLDEAIRFVDQFEQSQISLVAQTDNQGNTEYNQRLSEMRANAVKAYLISNGVSPEKIESQAIGETGVNNHSKPQRVGDRKVELALLGQYQVEEK